MRNKTCRKTGKYAINGLRLEWKFGIIRQA